MSEGLEERLQAAEAGLREEMRQHVKMRPRSQHLAAQIEAQEQAFAAERAWLAQRIAKADLAAREAEAWLAAMRGSTSWRLTAPMRWVCNRLRRKQPRAAGVPARAGAKRAAVLEPRAVLAQPLQFVVTGHINGSYSLAAVNRRLAQSIEALRPGRVRVVPVEGVQTGDLSGVPPDEVQAVADLVRRDAAQAGPIVVISQHYPLHVPAEPGDVTLALFFWEESVVPAATVLALNRDFDGVLAPSSFVAKVLVDSGVHVPVYLVGQAPALSTFRALGQERARGNGRPRAVLSFLHVSSCLPRKGVDVLLAAYARAFRRSDPVRLVIKGYPNPHNEVSQAVLALRAADAEAPDIVVINEDLEREAFLALYRDADVMVLPTRGEGFNLPAAEALGAGLQLIVTGHGGHLDFCTADTARLLDWRYQSSGSHVASDGSMWAEPSEDDLTAALREAMRDWKAQTADTIATRVRAGAARLDGAMDDARLVASIEAAAIDCIGRKRRHPPRIVWVTAYHAQCEIARYAAGLIGAWPCDGAVDGHMVLAGARAALKPVKVDASAPMRIGWRMGDADNVRSLTENIAQENPEIVVLQYQPGLLGWQDLGRILGFVALPGRVVAVALHATAELAEIPADARKMALEGLAGADRVIVHTLDDAERMKHFGLVDNVVMLPRDAPLGADTHAWQAMALRMQGLLLGLIQTRRIRQGVGGAVD